ncbi:deoxyribose-phosphate aldolase [Wenzhouxiangella marina]|uniref:Deoxyribose-phosphate aldolase n=1 Tax=Wenzhouxiangella marina TaxID=1579979 RepID=A0A0K0XUQ7_9GAMM|nr:deoxyribose-phosphate aldolase [Wenzhouxiangella marina]AKS41351.1 Deoxyribose-phosphate aldolase [Wenzhouxiangella marina]MBB6086898.1 deoxyribose-phosphate aldolase [Wenzhouxiangella marina]
MNQDLDRIARRAIALVDLTSLNDDDSDERIVELCQRASTPAGPVAAVCVYPRFVELAVATLRANPATRAVRVATVVNFPGGDGRESEVLAEIDRALGDDADEIDLVFPWRALLAGDRRAGEQLVRAARERCGEHGLKVILETGELARPEAILEAASIALDQGADFLKTSTGKVRVNATPEAARVLLELIRDRGANAGFKASGGLKTTEDAAVYLCLADEILGPAWADPEHFRFGASSLLDDLIGRLPEGQG